MMVTLRMMMIEGITNPVKRLTVIVSRMKNKM